MSKHGLRGNLLQSIESYLMNREQILEFNQAKSDLRRTATRVKLNCSQTTFLLKKNTEVRSERLTTTLQQLIHQLIQKFKMLSQILFYLQKTCSDTHLMSFN